MDIESQLRLDEDVEAVALYLEENGGRLDPDPAGEAGVWWATMRPRTIPEEQYYVRIGWLRYPDAPPSVKFGTAVGGSLGVTAAWPVVPSYRPGNFDICAPFTKEGFESHPEWAAQFPWPTTGNPFLWVVDIVQGHLDRSYQGRSG